MMLLSVVAITVARLIEHSRLGYGFATIRDDELAAEACGVPTLRLKLIATTISGALMGMAGAPFPYYIGYLEPGTAFGLSLWRQFHCDADDRRHHELDRATDRRDPAGNFATGCDGHDFVGGKSADRRILLIGFVIMAPTGVVGLVREFLRTAAPLAWTSARSGYC